MVSRQRKETAPGPPVSTYQTRISGYGDLDRAAGDLALAAYGVLYGSSVMPVSGPCIGD